MIPAVTGEGRAHDEDPVLPEEITDAFSVEGSPSGWRAIAGGHIHRNVAVDLGERTFVLQRINTSVFADVATLMANVVRVVDHLRARGMTAPELVATRDGGWTHVDGAGGTWRMWRAVEGVETRTVVTGRSDAYEAAHAFGSFLLVMDDLPGPPLMPAIEGFHDLPGRLAALLDAIADDALGRAGAVTDVLGEVFDVGERISTVLGRGLALPIRYVHGDAKVANVLFSAATGQARCVIDFDTVMLDAVLCDVGELLRSATTTSREDSEPVELDLDLVEAVATGFVVGCEGDLTSAEPQGGPGGGGVDGRRRGEVPDRPPAGGYVLRHRPSGPEPRPRPGPAPPGAPVVDAEGDVRDLFGRAAS